MNLLKKLFPKAYAKARFNLRPDSKHEVEIAFTHQGVDYWRFVNEVNIPIERAYAAMDIYAELAEKADSVYTESAFKAILEYLKKGENINAGVVAHNALERRSQITNVRILYKLASVLYFDANESVYSYDAEYNKKKIAAWMGDKDIEGFFLKTQLSDYLPSFAGLEMSLTDFTKSQNLEELRMLKFHLYPFSKNEKETDLYFKTKLLIETLENLGSLEK